MFLFTFRQNLKVLCQSLGLRFYEEFFVSIFKIENLYFNINMASVRADCA